MEKKLVDIVCLISFNREGFLKELDKTSKEFYRELEILNRARLDGEQGTKRNLLIENFKNNLIGLVDKYITKDIKKI